MTTKNNQTKRRLEKYAIEQRKHLNKVLKTNNYSSLKTSINSNQFQYAVILIYIGSTILFYNEKYILKSSRDDGQYNKLNIWDYLCKMDNTDNVLNEHRRNLGFPTNNNGFPILSSRQLQNILSGTSINQNTRQFVEQLYNNKQIKKILFEWQCSPLTEGRITKKNMNKLEDIFEHLEYNNIFPLLDKELQVKLKKIKDFTDWRFKNPETWNQLVNKLH